METSFVVEEDAMLLSTVILPQDFLDSSVSWIMDHGRAQICMRGKDQKQVDKTKKSVDQALRVVAKMRLL